MAVMIPNDPIDFHGSPGEQAVFEALRALDPRCYVFHSLRWIRAAQMGSAIAPQGEGDFIVFDPFRGILVIEVKSGGIRYEAGRWFQTNLASGIERPMQDPEQQADRTRWFLREHLKTRLRPTVVCPVAHAVWFPSVDLALTNLPPNLPRAMVLDRKSLDDPTCAVDEAFVFGSGRATPAKIPGSEVQRVVAAIAPTVCAAPSMRHALENRDRAFFRLTEEQARVLDFVEEQPRAVVAGAAGTGKTMVALQLARRLSDAGERVLFLCYNGALRRFLQSHHGTARVRFHTFDSLAAEHVSEGAGDFDATRATFLDLLSGPESPSFQHVIIDEGQDFDDDWIELLEACTRGTFYVFYDRNQSIQREKPPSWVESAECRLVLRRNCRMTTQLAKLSYSCAARPLPLPPDTIDGPKPRLHACMSKQGAALRVAKIVAELLGEREYEPHEIAILTLKTPESSLLGQFERVDAWKVVDVPTKGCVSYSTVRRFKGLEAPAVVLVDIEPAQLAAPSTRNLAYVGASRAVHELHVVFHGATRDGIACAVKAIVPGGRKTNAHALAMTLGATWEQETDDAEVLE